MPKVTREDPMACIKERTMFRRLIFGLAVLLIGLGLASCGQDTVQPYDSAAESGSVHAGSQVPDQVSTPEGLGDLLGGIVRGLFRVVKVVTDALGGTLELSRFKVVIPSGALETATETITLIDRQAIDGAVSCELLPHGISFERPVTLSMSLKGTNVDPNAAYTIYWYDEAAGRWVDIGATWDPNTQTVTAQLDHFSRYRAGRAGW
jgi:hypothetical protein